MRYVYALTAAVLVTLSALALYARGSAPTPAQFSAGAAPALSAEAWPARQLELRDHLRRELELPAARMVPRTRVSSRDEQGDYRLERIELTTPAGKAAALVFVPNGHVGRGPAVLWHLPVAAEKFVLDHMTPPGCIVMVFEGTPESASSGDDGPAANELSEDQFALNYLMGREDVDPDRIAVAGYGTRASRVRWLSALNDRVAATVLINAPASESDDARLAGLIVPRPQFVLTSDTASAQAVNSDERCFYRLFEVEELLCMSAYDDAPSTTTRWHAMEQAIMWLRDEL